MRLNFNQIQASHFADTRGFERQIFCGRCAERELRNAEKSLREHQNHIVTADLVAYAAPAVFKFPLDLLRAKKLLCFKKF